ncbi:MAG TPA: hypothetical protein VK717_08630 [Opitutaceae bacterium]|jgi:hypothetical protein|nr:hypothetical protein [Opitutaceae bacterium]
MPLLPADTPRLPKWPFLAGDAALLAIAFVIGSQARNPFAGAPLMLIVASVALGAVLAATPFISDYARKQDEALDERQRSLEALARTVATSAEQISIATASLHGLAETATKNLQLAEQLPARLQEKIGEVKSLRTAENAQLETTASHIRQAAAELARLETVAQKNLSTARAELDVKAGQVFSQLDAKIAVLAALVEKFSAALAASATEKPASARIAHREEPESPAVEPVVIPPVVEEKPAATEAIVAELAAEEPKMPRKRAPKKPKAENPEPALNLEIETAPPEPVAAPASADEFSQPSPDEAAPVSALSADGATRLLVTAYIGIGNKLFLRGAGPGLNWDQGVPLQFVSIGKWRWETTDATAPIQAKLYKNDGVECAALGTLTIEPGQQAEVTAVF